MTRGVRRLSLFLLGALCWQQLALAAYLCPQLAPEPPALAGCHDPAPDTPADATLCDAHCTTPHDRAQAAEPISVPALPSPELRLLPALQAVAALPVPSARQPGCDPPPRLRFCTLLI
ncbi:MAG TPA: hypothetical protein VFG21_05240 [Xanthomonadaceae bacterium]|nr:hypothetical protein [Xanthomonadaceae bacterium]